MFKYMRVSGYCSSGSSRYYYVSFCSSITTRDTQKIFHKISHTKPLGSLQNSIHINSRSLCSNNNNNSLINQKGLSDVNRGQTFNTFIRQQSTDTYEFYANMSSKHLATGSAFPPPQDGLLRIYSMKFCPYAQRALLVADAKGIPHDVVNVNLKKKPEWLLQKNPTGKVPTIDTPKGSLYESLVVADYLDEAYPSHSLNSADPFQKALDRIWIENMSKISTLYFKLLSSKADLEAAKLHSKDLTEAIGGFEKELERRGTLFFGGAQNPGMLDYMIWPWFERMPVVKLVLPTLCDYENAKKSHPKIEKWRQAMKEDPAVKVNFVTPENHLKFIVSFLSADTEVDYDFLAN